MGSRVLFVVAVAVVALISGGVVASAGDSGRGSRTSLTLQIDTQKLTVVDTGPSGASPGDLVIEADNLTRDGRPVGTAQLSCVAQVGSLANGEAQCSGTFYLPGGQLETQGDARSVNGSVSGTGAVTGGTRRYQGVRGSYEFDTTTGITRVIRFKLMR
jgi:hypothetical protein